MNSVRSYREYCPIARASEIFAERWTPLVVRNLLYGCTTFSDIARGVPSMSRSLLIKRLAELERCGVVRRTQKPGSRGSLYELTDAGRDLAGVLDALGEWGERWLEVTTEHTDPGFVLWSWTKFYVDQKRLPPGRLVVEFTFPDEPPANRRYWFLVDSGRAELCYSDPGGTPDLYVVARSGPFARWHIGEVEWDDALASGGITVTGPVRLRSILPTWNRRAPVRTVAHRTS